MWWKSERRSHRCYKQLLWTDDRLFGQHQIIHCAFNGQKETFPDDDRQKTAVNDRLAQSLEVDTYRSFMRYVQVQILFSSWGSVVQGCWDVQSCIIYAGVLHSNFPSCHCLTASISTWRVYFQPGKLTRCQHKMSHACSCIYLSSAFWNNIILVPIMSVNLN